MNTFYTITHGSSYFINSTYNAYLFLWWCNKGIFHQCSFNIFVYYTIIAAIYGIYVNSENHIHYYSIPQKELLFCSCLYEYLTIYSLNAEYPSVTYFCQSLYTIYNNYHCGISKYIKSVLVKDSFIIQLMEKI